MRVLFVLFALLGPPMAITMAQSARAADTLPSETAPDLRSVRAAVKAKKYDAAVVELKALIGKGVQHPDVYSLMGFALRKTGDRANAMTYYQKALAMEPGHKGALEYQGELFVELGQIDNARANLAKLSRLCLFGCEEYDDLKQAIERARKGS